MASNEEWVVPASLKSRRWFVRDVLETQIQNHEYFEAIQKQLDEGGYAAMLYDLLNRDISKANLRKVPVTDALVTQRKLSLGTTERWWLDCLHRGYVFQSRLGWEDHFGEWYAFLTTEILFASYTAFAKECRERHPLSRELFGKWMGSTGATPARQTNGVTGERMVDANTSDGRTSRVAELVKQANPRGYKLGNLDDARAAFLKASGLTVEWSADGEQV